MTGKRLMTDAEGISIHALREEGDLLFNCWLEEPYKFLSTSSARRATMTRYCIAERVEFLSTPSARRATI